MVQATHTRKKHIITEIANGKQEVFKYINQAKRESVLIQIANGGSGCGAVIVDRG